MNEAQEKRERRLRRMHARRHTPRYRSLLAHWAVRSLQPPASGQSEPLPKPSKNQVAISLAGHATVVIRYQSLTILCDPLLGDWRGAIRREVRSGIASADLEDVDLVLLSNQDPDHLDPATLARLPRSATVVVPPHAAGHVSSLGFARVIELAADQDIEHRRVTICAATMRHGNTNAPALGYVLRGDGPSVFFCGASGYFDGFAKVGRRYAPDIALLPISGYSPISFRDSHMSPLDALYAFEDLHSKVMIPIRYGNFALSYERLGDPAQWLSELVIERDLEDYVFPIANGQSRIFVRPGNSSGRGGPRGSSTKT